MHLEWNLHSSTNYSNYFLILRLSLNMFRKIFVERKFRIIEQFVFTNRGQQDTHALKRCKYTNTRETLRDGVQLVEHNIVKQHL